MKQVISKYVDISNNGLILFDMPTGYGKTTAIVEFVKKHIQMGNTRRIFYITNLKNNLPVSDICEKLNDSEWIYLMSYADNVIEKWESLDNVPDEVTSLKEYKELNKNILSLKNYRDKNVGYGIDLDVEEILKNKVVSSESLFRKKIKLTYLTYKNKKTKVSFIMKNQWLEVLYPQVNIDKYKVIIMTTSKFYSKIDTLVTKPYYLYNSEIINQAVVFIDEFDASKSVILDKIIDDGIKTKLDIMKLFSNVYQSLQMSSFPTIFEEMTNTSNENSLSNKQILEYNIQNFDNINEKYKLNLTLKSVDINDDRYFIFDEFVRIMVKSNNQKGKLLVEENSDLKVNEIISKNTYEVDFNEEVLLSDMLIDMVNVLSKFYVGISMMANNLLKTKNGECSINEVYRRMTTKEEAIWSVLNLFNISEDVLQIVYDEIAGYSYHDNDRNKQHINYQKNKTVIDGKVVMDKKERFLRKGFEFLSVEDSDFHSMQTKPKLFKFNATPEDLLIRVCNKAFVVGVSATANLQTVIGNYDLKYIKNQLGVNYYTLSKKDYENLRPRFDQMLSIYDSQIDIKTNILPSYINGSSDQDIMNYGLSFLSSDLYRKFIEMCDSKKTSLYYRFQMLQFLYVFQEVLLNNKTTSFVYFGNSFLRTQDKLNRNIIEEMITELQSVHKTYDLHFYEVRSRNFSVVEKKYTNTLQKGQRVFVYTTYKTLGTGKNIQYELSNDMSSELYVERDYMSRKDFDGVMLSLPTNLSTIVREGDGEREKTLAKFLFEQQYLYFKDRSTYQSVRKNIIYGFKKLYYGEYANSDFNDLELDKSLHTTQIIIQAVGRICRTVNKSKLISIFSEDKTLMRLKETEDDINKDFLNKEYLELLNSEVHTEIEKSKEKFNDNKSISSEIFYSSIFVRTSEAKVKEWNDIRDYFLANPTVLRPEEKYEKYYFSFSQSVSKYFYYMKDGYFVSSIKYPVNGKYYEVSEDYAKLKHLGKIVSIRNEFMNRYPLSFHPNKYILNPAAFRQIYLGALGEIVGKAIFMSHLGIDLKDIEYYKHFEFFDYVYNDVYIDFKHWVHYKKDMIKGLKNVDWKAKRVKPKKVLIVNILRRGENKHNNYVVNGIEVMTVPYIIKKQEGRENYNVDSQMIKRIRKFIFEDGVISDT